MGTNLFVIMGSLHEYEKEGGLSEWEWRGLYIRENGQNLTFHDRSGYAVGV